MKQESIVYVIFSFGNGGTQKMLTNILNLVKLPAKKTTVYLYNNTSKDNIDFKLDPKINIVSYSGKGIFKFWVRLQLLYKIIKQENASKVFCLSTQGAYIALFLRTFTNLNFKIFYRMVSVDKALVSSNRILIGKIKALFFYEILCNRVDKIIAQTDYMANELIKKIDYLNTNKVIVIKNLIESQIIIEKSKVSIDINNPYIIFVGKLSIEKNIPGIIDAFNLIKEQIEENLIIVGSGYQKALLEKKILELGLEKRIQMLGHQNNPYKYINNANLMVLFSNYEGLPNVILEAMVCKTPVISSDFEGVEEIITDGENGNIVTRRNVHKLSEVIKEVLQTGNIGQITEMAAEFVNDMNNKSVKEYKNLLN